MKGLTPGRRCALSPLVGVAIALTLTVCPAPQPAAGGYDIAHAVKRSCEPDGPLLFKEKFKSKADRGRPVSEPGAVIGCPKGPLGGRLQIAAGPERIMGDRYVCSYYSHADGAANDICSSLASLRSGVSALQMTRSDDRPDELVLVGAVGTSVTRVDLAPRPLFRATRAAGAPLFIAVDGARSTAVGGSQPYKYFALPVPEDALCSSTRPRVIVRDQNGVVDSVGLIGRGLAVIDGPGSTTSIGRICNIEVPRGSNGLDPLTQAAVSLLAFIV